MTTALVAGEINNGAVSPVTYELITAARGVADTVFVAFVTDSAPDVNSVSVDRVYIAEHPELGTSDGGVFDAAVAAFQALAGEISPDVVLFARSDAGAAVAPRLAYRLGSALAQDCTAIEQEGDGSVTVTRPVFGGNATGKFRFTGAGPHVVVLRPGSIEPETNENVSPEIINFDISDSLPERQAKLIDTVREQRQGVRLEDAEIVVSGGRGLGGPEPFTQLQELADLLGGALGASRAACDAGWIDHSHQVGLTGKSIAPRLYLTFGISGASQHMAGCSAARNIVAVNTDGDSNIFREARFGVVGDWAKVLPAFIATLKDLG